MEKFKYGEGERKECLLLCTIFFYNKKDKRRGERGKNERGKLQKLLFFKMYYFIIYLFIFNII